MKRILLFLLFYFVVVISGYTQDRNDFVSFINEKHVWVDSVFNALSLKERIAQLFLVRAHTNLGQAYIDSVAAVIQKEQLGGVVLFQGGPVRHANMLNKYQSFSKVPLLVATDGEWGLGMRMPDSTISYPYQMTLGAIQNNELIFEMGKQIAKDFTRLGVHFNFAPVVDVNNNPNNPVINFRSFGDDKCLVTEKASRFMCGLLEGGIISSLKHFPGHGDTDVDSHHDLPQLGFSKDRLDEIEMYPFKKLISFRAPAVMVAHMHIPALDSTVNMPASISKKVVSDLLKKELGFKGLVVTDAMDMKGVKKFFPNGEADVMAIEAGNDLVEISENSARAIRLVENAVEAGRISKFDLDSRVKRVLAAKYWLGLHDYQPVNTHDLVGDLNSRTAQDLVKRLAEAAVTVLKSEKGIERSNSKGEVAIVTVGGVLEEDFENGLDAHLVRKKRYVLRGDEDEIELKRLLKQIRKSKQIVLVVHDARSRPGNKLNMSEGLKKFVYKLAGKRTVTVMFTNPYVLDELSVGRSRSVIMAYQNDSFMQMAALKVLLGDIKAKGRLPVQVNQYFSFGGGM
ncbi:glycoside hydrolase family 3 [Sphingobacterium sp. UT-1RO-CII-1]|uniref:glycoside hydrolase family 3 protein n=1 Tax=Sphingobacterium sp. UT-1RO-CII-1 TaxID=2995225 RepID=UPI00227A0B67|nr:glycoside hydrolase family 3 N-terminal domain-containing protein [Sphingobacterium sp. UT-1RO-CII-1]MCY4780897.1 glycoside hydrolase family 3 [Sphingobacterium sp. UT-1RO-CII-1]